MEQPGPSSDADRMEESVAESVSEEGSPGKQLHNCTSNVEEEEQVHDNNAEESEKCSQTDDEVDLDDELIETTTDFPVDIDKTELTAQTHSHDLVGGTDSCNTSTVFVEDRKLPFSLLNEAGSSLETTTSNDVVESSPSVLEGRIETLMTLDDGKDSLASTQNRNEQPSVLVRNCSTESSPTNDSGLVESPSSPSVHSTSKISPTDSTTTSGISNGPSTPGSDTISSLLASFPQTCADTPAPSHPSSNPYDTDCSRKLISQIQRSLSQESLLDELESELLACQLPGGESEGDRKGSPLVNGLPTDQEGCMMVFEKCVQNKYGQQEKAIQR